MYTKNYVCAILDIEYMGIKNNTNFGQITGIQ